MRIRQAAVIAVLGSCCVAATVCPASTGELSHEDRIIAGLVFNFCKVVTWPVESEVVHLVVAGDDGPGRALLDINGRVSGGRTLRVTNEADGSDLATCDLLYLSPAAAAAGDSLLQSLGTSPVLTVSTAEDFSHQGGMIEMTRDRGRIRLKVHRDRATAADLTLSSQLLKIATVVDD